MQVIYKKNRNKFLYLIFKDNRKRKLILLDNRDTFYYSIVLKFIV